MKTIRTAKGKMLDMGALAAQNEETRAISNVPINARGDIIDNRGKITVPRETISKEFYKDNVPGSDDKEIGIKDEVVPKVKEDIPVREESEIEVSRTEREREDGTSYYEVEYMDGSMEEIEIISNPKDTK